MDDATTNQPGRLPCSFVIFGATGDLSTHKLLPALFNLENAGRFEDDLSIVAFARHDWVTDDLTGYVRAALKDKASQPSRQGVLDRFLTRFRYVRGDFNDVESYRALVADLAPGLACSRTVFYLAIRPADFVAVIKNLKAVGLNEPRGMNRIVIEKPFGEDLESAQVLNRVLHQHFDEEQIYRIDHFLGKETVQNLFVFRFANTLIEPLWNRNFIDHVQITVAESGGIEKRAGYYDHAGALRDMLQNHLMQLLTVVAMEPPPALEADALRDEKVKVLRSIRPIAKRAVHAHAVRAQYTHGNIDGSTVVSYQQEENVEPDSITETFVAAKFYIDNWRWRGVPFYLRTGKRMPKQHSMIAIRFRHPPQQLFRETPLESITPNWMLLSIQPEESMRMEIHVKQPGLNMNTRVMQMNASFLRTDEQILDAYETLLLDVIEGDRSLFIRFDEAEWAWRVIDPILKFWTVDREYIPTYSAGSWGPAEANRLFDSDDQVWRNEL
ncbi:glucose-6-phosphate dehydrogenase [Nitrosomonas sp. HPC101]|uniref:glucose-6-phosphate dehydrogenase n=1 Tax=Nitrosomonas sp. HPC101 TaxID=1658667 RepID=UPI00136B8F15|nr:glucose-6-phosphate dehydrogenase [Nitrosomonas sp. HPC101]MXS85220.1 glucose-6-phosphate dehydrogenase [Nitrosomonas sp. HPC101]